MKTNILTLAALCSLTILSSCNKEGDLLLAESEIKTYTLGAVVTNETASSKVAINSNLEFNWSTNDALAIRNSDKSAANFTIEQGGGGSNSATFTGTATGIEGYPAYVVYPYNARTFNEDGSYTFSQPLVQNHTYNADNGSMNMTELGKHAYMWGKSIDNVSGSTIPSVTMTHLMSIIVINLDALVDKHLTKLTITSTFPQTATVNFAGGVVIPESGSYSTFDIKFKGEEGIKVAVGNVARIAVLPHTVKEGSSWNFIAHYKDGEVAKYMTGTKTFTTEVVFAAGKGRKTSLPALTDLPSAVPSYAFAMENAGTNMLDPRDFKTYATVKIARAGSSGPENYVWMNENLNVGTFTTTKDETDREKYDEIGIQKRVTGNAPTANEATYGGLYEWAEAISGGNIISTSNLGNIQTNGRETWEQYGAKMAKNGNNIYAQGVCPEGWHIPLKQVWDNSFKSGQSAPNMSDVISKGFKVAYYSGFGNAVGVFSKKDENSYWWTSTVASNTTQAQQANTSKTEIAKLNVSPAAQNTSRAIRCVMNW